MVSVPEQTLSCYEDDKLTKVYTISTAKNGVGEQLDSGCTPRGKHGVCDVIGLDEPENTVFVGRVPTGEIYNAELRAAGPDRDWILTRIIRLTGLEPGRNQGGTVDTYDRYIYVHGTPIESTLGEPGSKGCIRMRNQDVIGLADWVNLGTFVFIEG